MVAIEYEDILGPCIVTAISSYQMEESWSSQKEIQVLVPIYECISFPAFEVMPPTTTGENVDVRFTRVFRAHQNCVESHSVFLGSLWSGSILLHQLPASLLGIVYVFGRAKYFRDYSDATEKRMLGFKMSLGSIAGLGLCSLIGVCLKIYRYYKC